jgi:glycine/D-amino acid oxidase-like deaminating enzyme
VKAEQPLSTDADVVIIGAGAMGLFTAMYLAREGRDVVVLDRNRAWSEASGANAGSLAVQNKMLPLVPFVLEALRLWRSMAETLGTDVGFQSRGGYKVATTEAERNQLLRTAEAQQAMGVDVRALDRADVESKASWLGSDVLAATFSTKDSFSNPLLLGPALTAAARRAGVRIEGDAEVRQIVENGALLTTTSRGTIRSRAMVVAAGAWSGLVAALFGVRLPMALEANMLTVTEPAGFIMDAIVTHARGILTLKQVSNGTCLIGGGWLGSGSLANARKDLDYESLLHNIRLAVRIVPGLANLNVVRHWAAYEGTTPDFLPYIGRLPNSHNAFIIAGARGGYTLSPFLGQLTADLVIGREPCMDISAFSPGRFGHA